MSEGSAENHELGLTMTREEGQSLFSLKRSNSSATAPFIQVDFSLPPSLKEDPFFNSITLIPTFNRDGKFYTPSFILGSELVIGCFMFRISTWRMTKDTGWYMRRKYRKWRNNAAKLYFILLIQFVPKPSKANSYCCICREPFEDYLTVVNFLLQHINIPRHRELMKKSAYYSMIEDLCGQSNGSSGKAMG